RTPAHRTRLDPPAARAGRCPGRPIEARQRRDRRFAREVPDREVPDRAGEMAEATADRPWPEPDSVGALPTAGEVCADAPAGRGERQADRRRRLRGAGRDLPAQPTSPAATGRGSAAGATGAPAGACVRTDGPAAAAAMPPPPIFDGAPRPTRAAPAAVRWPGPARRAGFMRLRCRIELAW